MTDIKTLIAATENVPYYKEYEAPDINFGELYRYSGIPVATDTSEMSEIKELAAEAIRLCEGALTYRVAYSLFRLDEEDELMNMFRSSKDLMTNLKGCDIGVIFAATVGAGIDRMIRRYKSARPAMSLMLQAYGAERAESLCNTFNEDINAAAVEAGYKTHPRYSPGFGDLPIKVQPLFLDKLNAAKRLGITLGDSYLMSPSKSVTAVIGFKKV
ncbi:MAG: hypothetical protein K6E68_02200 [Lachnospiraceae bacterium]|nr:hypothetical protein [Lachnospiraceae bacterium]